MGTTEQQKSGAWWAMFVLGAVIIGGALGGIIGMLNIGGLQGLVDAALSDDRRDLQGEWVVLMEEVSGRSQPVPSESMFVVEGDRVRVTPTGSKGTNKLGRFVLDPSRKAIDLYETSAKVDGTPEDVTAGIYHLDKTHLTLCIARPRGTRPKDIESTGNNHCHLIVLKRP